jgi:hypothetical protein
MSDSLLLPGATDVTLAVAEAAADCGTTFAGIVAVGECLSISYSETRIRNARSVDLHEWAQLYDVKLIPSTAYDDLLTRFSPAPRFASSPASITWYRGASATCFRGCATACLSPPLQLRGGAPLNWAIPSGRAETWVSSFEMADGGDEGLVFGMPADRTTRNHQRTGVRCWLALPRCLHTPWRHHDPDPGGRYPDVAATGARTTRPDRETAWHRRPSRGQRRRIASNRRGFERGRCQSTRQSASFSTQPLRFVTLPQLCRCQKP